MRLLLWAMLLLIGPSFIQAGDADPEKWKPGMHEKVPTANDFSVDLFIPDAYASQPTRTFPILYLSAPDGKPKVSAYKDWANERSVILLGINDATNGPWPPIIERQKAAVAFAERELRISKALRFSMGMSGGGLMSWQLCQNYPNTHAGIVMLGSVFSNDVPPRHVTVAFIHGDKESCNPHIATEIQLLKKSGNLVREIVRPGGHIPGEHSDHVQMLNWMLDHARITHPNLSTEEIEEGKADAMKRIESLGSIADPGARFASAEELLAIPHIEKWGQSKALMLVWLKAGIEKAGTMVETSEKYEFLTGMANDPRLKLVSSTETRVLTTLLTELRRDPVIKKEAEASTMLQQIERFESQAKNKTAWQQVLAGYTALKARYPGTRAALKADEGIKRAEENIDPPKKRR